MLLSEEDGENCMDFGVEFIPPDFRARLLVVPENVS